MIKKLIRHDKSAGLGDFDDEESEKNEKACTQEQVQMSY